MKRSLAILVLACAALAGCRSAGRKDLLTRDLRLEEDRIYELEDMLDQTESELESAQRENEALRKQLGGGTTSSAASPAVELPPGVGGPSKPIPRLRDRRESPKLEPPKIELEPGLPEGPPKLDRLPSSGSSSQMDGSFIPHTQPVKIVMNRRLTGGLNQDGSPGDEGILVAFAPRDAQGRVAAVPGDVSIVVLDPSKQGAAARVARWDFTADEAMTHFRQSPLGDGLQFQLPWPSEPPMSRDLRLYVRYATPDRKYLTADAKIKVEPLKVAGAGWTAAPPRDVAVPAAAATSQLVSHDAPLAKPEAQPAAQEEPRRAAASPADDADDTADARNNSIHDKPVWKPYR
jgi:outer membrane murein-binding lipoprotein Lpp